jgi:hypothetical protein
LVRHTRTSVNRFLSQEAANAACESPGLVWMKASATLAGDTTTGAASDR